MYSNKSIILPTHYAAKVKRALEGVDYRSLDIVNFGIDGVVPKTELFKLDISFPHSPKKSNIHMNNSLGYEARYRRSYIINVRGYIVLKIPNCIKDKMLDFMSIKD